MNQPVPSSPSKKMREYGAFALILAAAILLFWWRVWIPSPADRMHFTDDIVIKDYPTRMGLFRQIFEGRAPLWDPYQFGGWPGLANCEAGLFYPLNWIAAPFCNAPEAAFQATQWLVLLHFFIAGMGAYRYSRYIGISSWGSAFAAMAFTFCGFLCAHKKHTNMIFTLAWLPWLLLQAERWIRESRGRFLFRLTVLLAMAYFAGHPQSALYLSLLIAARLIYGVAEKVQTRAIGGREWLRRGAAPIVGVFLLAGALTAIQYAPTAELIQQGERSKADVFQRSSEFSLPPSELLEALFPEVMSSWSQTEVFYWGLAPLLLALHFALRGRLKALDRYLIGVFAISVLFSMGEYVFAYDLSYLLVPGAAWVRAPSRWIFFAGLPLALAAGREIDHVLSKDPLEAHRTLNPVFWKIVGVAGILAIALLLFVALSAEYAVPAGERLAVRQEMLRSFLLLLLFGGSFLLLFDLAMRRQIQPKFFAFAALLIGWVDLGTHFRTFELAPGAGGYRIDAEVKQLRDSAWNHRTKVYFNSGGERTLYHGAAQNFYEVDGQSPLTPLIHLELREDTQLQDPEKPNLLLYRLLGVQTVLTDILDLPPVFERETKRLHRIEGSWPRAFAVNDFLRAGADVQRELMKLQSLPVQQVGLIEAPEGEEADFDRPDGALFPRPFLLASCSANAVQSNAFLVVDGKNYFADFDAEEESAGYCLAVADPDAGIIEDAEIFNLMKGLDDPEHRIHQRLQAFIDKIPDGKIVFAAVRDNAANSLLPEGLGALRAIGASLDARGRYRLAHAVIGRKGGPIGSALEIFSATEAMVLQTEKSIYMEGTICPKPAPEWLATTVQADKWHALQKKMKEGLTPPLRYDLNWDVAQATDVLYAPMPISIFSAPKKTTAFGTIDQAAICLGGREYALNQRGYNLATVDPETWEVIDREAFDLFADYDSTAAPTFIKPASPENKRMRDFIRSVPDGRLILGAIRDDATDLMTPETLDCLHEIGSSLLFNMTDSNARKRISHAFVAVKGASRCIEAFAKEKDAVVFTRYPGGPALSHTETGEEAGRFEPVNPVDEMEETLEERREETADESREERPFREWAILEDDVSRIRLSGQSEQGDMVFLSEIYYPGWKAYVDGVRQPIQRLDYYFRGVWAAPGRHTIEMIYAPESHRLGAAISLIALIALAGWWIALRF
ncbi:MAG: YfhO family protein [Candidatus Omnitrophica bacterium]|nr:YfhO family protein [Candidatus Omnitrophota bacterium]